MGRKVPIFWNKFWISGSVLFVFGHKANSLQMENIIESLIEMIEFHFIFNLKLKFNSKLLKIDHQSFLWCFSELFNIKPDIKQTWLQRFVFMVFSLIYKDSKFYIKAEIHTVEPNMTPTPGRVRLKNIF